MIEACLAFQKHGRHRNHSTFIEKFKQNQLPLWAGLTVIGVLHYRRLRQKHEEEINDALKQGILDKKKGLFAKRRMFLLTEGPHLYYVDPSAMVLKGEIPWSATLKTEIRDFRIFFVHVPGRIYYLIDPDSTSKDWCSAIGK